MGTEILKDVPHLPDFFRIVNCSARKSHKELQELIEQDWKIADGKGQEVDLGRIK